MHRCLVALALVGACNRAVTYDEVLAAWLPASVKQAWQGSWVTTLKRDRTDEGTRVALVITGERAQIFDGTREQDVTFAIDRPCEATFTARGGEAWHLQFAFVGGKLQAGNGAVGLRRGTAAIVCATGRDRGAPEEGVYVLDGDRCTSWKPAGQAWSGRAGVCVQSQLRGRDEVDVGTEHYATTLFATGELLADEAFERSLKRGEAVQVASYQEAKARLQAERRSTDPLEIAKAAGGVVGDRSSIAGLQATFAADRAALLGQALELTGEVVEISTLTVHGQVWNQVVMRDPDHITAPSVVCQTLDDVAAVVAGARLGVRGSIDPDHDLLRLAPCGVVRR